MTEAFDTRQVRRAFSRSAAGYAQVAALQREIETRLLESLDYFDDPALARKPPAVVVDLGCGPAHATAALCKRWPKAQVLAMDLALPMLREAKQQSRGWVTDLLSGSALSRPRPGFERICADARNLPLANDSVDVLFSNLCLQWVDDLPAVFAGFRRVLRPGGLLLVSSFGPQTLVELREAFAHADALPHVSPFASIAQFGDALMHAGFRDPVLDRDLFVHGHRDLPELMRELRAMGATNALHSRRHTLTGKSRFAAAAAAYEAHRRDDGVLPASWEAIYAHAWAPEPGAPIRENGVEIASVPVSRIPIRRR